jgi:hypothetical protein
MGSGTTYGMAVGGVSVSPTADNLLITLDGVIQHPGDAYTVSGSNIVFASGPGSGVEFYGIIMGQSASTGQGSIGADELKVSGDGSSGQVLTSDGDGTFSWATDTENYLPLAGGTMSGAINLGSQNVTNGGTITGTFVGNITGNVTGNTSGTAATVTGGTQASITSAANLVTVGTIGTGVWNGTAIASAYLDADTAHLSGTQTFSGAKTFTSGQIYLDSSTDADLKLSAGGNGDSQIGFWDGSTNKAYFVWDRSDDRMELNTALDFEVQTNLITTGNTTVTGNLTVNGTGSDVITGDYLYLDAADNSAAKNLVFRKNDDTWLGQIEFHPSSTSQIVTRVNQPLAFGVNNSQKVTIGTDGNTTFAGNIVMSEDKRISIGTWDNSGFTGSNAYGLSIDSELPIIHMSDTDTNKKAFFGLSGDNMYIGGNPVDDMIFQTGSGVERLRIRSSTTNWCLDVTSPSPYGMQINCADASTGSHDMFKVKNGAGTEVIGAYGDKTVKVNHKIDIDSNSDSTFPSIIGQTDSYVLFRLEQWYGNEGSLVLKRDNTNRVQFTGGASGVVSFINTGAPFAIGRTTALSPVARLTVASALDGGTTPAMSVQANTTTASGSVIVFHSGDGGECGAIGMSNLNAGNSVAYNTSSDYRLKQKVKTLPNALDRVNQMKPVEFEWKKTKDKSEGFIAHELQEICDYAVTGEKDGMQDVLYQEADEIPKGKKFGDVKESIVKAQQVDYAKLTPILVKAVQELSDKLDTANAKITALENA